MDDPALQQLMTKLTAAIDKSLKNETARNSSVTARLSYVCEFPTGEEVANVIGLEFCGVVFRVAHCQFNAGRQCAINSRMYEFPENKLAGPGIKLLEYVARCISHFLDTTNIKAEKLCLGVALGFPISQGNMEEALLRQWNRTIECRDLIHEDIFLGLKIALKKYENTKSLYVIGAVSDATACILSGIYNDPTTKMSVCIGDDVNLSYIERFENITITNPDSIRERTIINLDIRSFGEEGYLDSCKTKFDKDADDNSSDPGNNTFSKLVAVPLLGEVIRRCLVAVVEKGAILDGRVSPNLNEPGAISMEEIAAMEKDEPDVFTACWRVLEKLGYTTVPEEDCLQIRFVCRCVVRRSCNLLAACIAAMVNRMNMTSVTINVDGFLVRDYPNYYGYLTKKIFKLRNRTVRFSVALTDKDDMAIGAALVAAIYREGVMEIEDKYRSLPDYKVHRCGYLTEGVCCKECKCVTKYGCMGKCIEKFPQRKKCLKPSEL